MHPSSRDYPNTSLIPESQNNYLILCVLESYSLLLCSHISTFYLYLLKYYYHCGRWR